MFPVECAIQIDARYRSTQSAKRMLNERNITGPIEDLKESLFLDRYHRLLSWAMRLTNYDRSSAEDLVHDAFIQFTRGRTSCDTILNIDGYLRRMLRYLHLARLTCHTEQLDKQSSSIADYDSLSLGLRACDIDRHLQAKEQLFEICRYACIRKETSRAGSVLILRFFYEYTPSEIGKLLGRPRHSVDEWQRVARNELKIYLDNPRQLTFVRLNSPASVNLCDAFIPQTDLSTALRRMVFNSRLGDCLAVDELKEIYISGNLEKLTPGRLAHIVSCWRCLDTTNQFLGLPTLSERFDIDEDDRIEPPNDKNGSGRTSNDIRRRITRHLREVIEHKPRQLSVRVNGVLASSFSVESGGEFRVNVSHTHDDCFIDVSSEQGVRLLLLEAQPQFESWGQIDLSEGRLLEVSFSRNTLSVIYHAPELHAASEREPLRLLPPQSDELSVAAENTFWQRLKSIFKTQEFLRPAWLSPACVTLLIAILLLTALIKRTPPTITASTLLQRAAVAERRRNSVAGHVIHRLITLEERQPNEGTVISRQRIEMWEDLANGSRAERIFDDRNRLLAERLESPTNGSTVFHHKPNGSLPLNAEDVFPLQPTAVTFAMLIGVNPVLALEQRPGLYVISYSGNSSTPVGQLLKATLTLSEDDLRPIEETLLIEHLGQIREYRFIEVRFDRISHEELDSTVFHPTPEKKSTSVVSTISTGNDPSPSKARITSVASTELEIEAAYLLDKAKADRGEQIALAREKNGSLRIEGVVETSARKEELLQSLKPLINNPTISINIQAADTKSTTDLTRQVEWSTLEAGNSTPDRIAVDREVREYLLRTRTPSSTAGADLDGVVNAFASKTVNRSYRALFHAVQLKQLVDRFSDVKMRTMSAEARDKLHTIIRTHGEALGREYASLADELVPVFHSSISSDARERQHIDNDEQLIAAVQKLSQLVRTINDAIRSAFTISAQGSSVGIKSAQFWKDLTDAQQVAVRISKY
jgi:RNA polymerase sigma factor (sigma-70 family)